MIEFREHFPVLVVTFAGALSGLLYGFQTGQIGQIMTMMGFENLFEILNVDGSAGRNKSFVPAMTTGLFLLGMFGAISVSLFADKFGRKISIMIAGGLICPAGCALQVFSNSLSVFFPGRIISGFSVGMLSGLGPLYISEHSPASIRGHLVGFQFFMITFGILLASILNSIIMLRKPFSADMEWRFAISLQLIPAFLLVVVISFMPESPRWLVSKGREEDAKRVLGRNQNQLPLSSIIHDEYQKLKVFIENNSSNSWTDLAKDGMRYRVFLAFMISAFRQLSGVNALIFYQASLLSSIGFSKITGNSTLT